MAARTPATGSSPRTGRTWRRLYEVWEQGGLRDHYAEQVAGEDGREDLLEDTRLRDYLRELSAGALS